MAAACNRLHPRSVLARDHAVRFQEALAERERDGNVFREGPEAADRERVVKAAGAKQEGRWQVHESMERFAPARVHARLAEDKTCVRSVRNLHACLARAHEELRGCLDDEEKVRSVLSGAVAEAERMTREEEEADRDRRLAMHSRVYADRERQRQEALQFWYNIQESSEIMQTSLELQQEMGLL